MNLEVLLYPDIDYIVSSLEEKYFLWDLPYKINPETIVKLKKLIKGHSSTRILNLINGGKIPLFIEIDSKVRLSKVKIQNKIINSNSLFKIIKNKDDARVMISIQKHDNEINIVQ